MDEDQLPQVIKAALRKEVADLPPAPAAAVKLLQLTQDKDSGAAAITRVIETDPTMAVKILRAVNSAFYGFPRRIDSIERAVTLLGNSAIRELALQFMVYEGLVRRASGTAFDRVHYWQHSLLVAILSRLIGERVQHPDPDALYAAGLLHDLGKIILETHGRVRFSEFLSASRNSGNPGVEDEKSFFGVSHDKLGAAICTAWGLPDSLCRIQSLHHQGFAALGLRGAEAQEVAVVSLADFIAWTQGFGSVVRHGNPVMPPEVREVLNPKALDIGAILHRADEELKKVGSFYGLKFPSVLQLRANLVATAIELSGVSAGYSGASSGRTGLRASLTAPHRSLEPAEFIPWTLDELHRELGIERLLFMRIEPSRRCLLATHAWPPKVPDEDEPPQEILISGLAGDLVHCLRDREPRVLKSSPENDRVLRLLGAQEAAAVPVMSQGRLQGLLWLYGDPRVEASRLPEVAGVASELGIALQHSQTFQLERERAQMDGLTRLQNRAAIDRFLPEMFRDSGQTGKPFAVGLLDVDHFKTFNDRFGHQSGDDVLRIVADSMRRLTRPRDFVGRYGGEEFLFVLLDTDRRGSLLYAERIRREIEAQGRVLRDRFPGHALTASFGVAVHAPVYPSTGPAALIAAADQALYAAKARGRNRVVAAWDEPSPPLAAAAAG